jgi:glutamate:GABA antiporter
MKTIQRTLFHRDVVSFTILAVVAVRLVPLAAASGPSVVLVLLLAAFVFYAPVSIATVILSRMHPSSGGIYFWSKTAFGDLHGFITAWAYWTQTLVFLPSVLLFTSSQSAFIIPGTQHLAENHTYLTSVSIGAMILILLLNIAGMRLANRFHNVAAATTFVIVAIVVALASVSWMRFGSSTDFQAAAWIPEFEGIKDLLFFSSVVYMLSGSECASQLGDEVHDPDRTIPRALFNAGLLIFAIYAVTSICLLVAVSSSELSGLQGFATAVSISARRLGGETFESWGTTLMALLLVVAHLGTVSVWLTTTARLPFVIGLDHYLPSAFGRLHPRYGSPYVALTTLAAATILLIVLSSFGGAANQVYQILISIEIVIYFIPYLYLFAALIKLKTIENRDRRTGPWDYGVTLVSAVGFLVTAMSMILALVPGEQVESHSHFYAMVFGSLAFNLAVGTGLYLWGRRIHSHDLPEAAAP